MSPVPAPHDSRELQLQRVRLGRFLAWMFPVGWGFIALYGVAAILFRSPTLALAALDVLLFEGALLASRRSLSRGDLARAATFSAAGLFGMALVGAFVLPFVLPVLILIPVAGVVVALPHQDATARVRIAVAAVLTTVACVAVVELVPPPFEPPPLLLERIVLLSATAIASLVISVLLYVDAQRVQHSLRAAEEAEEASGHQAERFRTLTLASAQVVWTTGPDGVVVEDSPSWRAFTGQGHAEWLGSRTLALHPEDRDRVRAAWDEALRMRIPYQVEYRLRHKSGVYRQMISRGVPVLDGSGQVREWVGTMIDVTAERESARQVSEESRRKDEFLAMLGHELRNPLAAVVTASALLRTRGESSRPLEVIERQGQHLARLVDDLLDATRIATGKIVLQLEEVELADVARRGLEMVQEEIGRRRQQVEVDLDPVRIRVDPLRLTQVVTNLLSNATRYTPDGGSIRLTVRGEDDSAVLRVSDTGIGMKPDFIANAFDLFSQSERADVGLGVGLALVRRLVELHGGSVSAKSDGEGRGSTFTVRLPRERAGVAAV